MTFKTRTTDIDFPPIPKPNPLLSINPHLRNLKQSPTLEINERCQLLEEKGMKIYRLGFGQSPFPVPEVITGKFSRFERRFS